MMFEKSLKSIEENPHDDERTRAYLDLLGQMPVGDERAEALAQLGVVLLDKETLQAFDHLEGAFRMAPQNLAVLEALGRLFEKRNRKDALARLRTYAKAFEPPPPEPAPAPSGIPVASAIPSSDARDVGDAGDAGTAGFDAAFDTARRPEELEDTNSTAVTEPKRLPPRLRSFIRKTRIRDSLANYASEFADSLTGMVHFLHYLKHTRKITPPEYFRCARVLNDMIEADPLDSQARIRYAEVIKIQPKTVPATRHKDA